MRIEDGRFVITGGASLIVMRDRSIVGELTGDELTQAHVMKTIAGGERQ